MLIISLPRFVSPLAAIVAVIGLASCAEIPEIDDLTPPSAENADYPTLVPVEQILGNTRTSPETDQRTADQLSARAAALQARANRLKRQSGIDEQTRRRLDGQNAAD